MVDGSYRNVIEAIQRQDMQEDTKPQALRSLAEVALGTIFVLRSAVDAVHQIMDGHTPGGRH